MAEIFMSSKVQYLCTCKAKRPITRVYFCRYCSKLRCGDCVSHEVDSHFCPNCLEYMPSPEAKLKKNRCANCFDCPSCMHTLSTRATSIQIPSPDDPKKNVPKKVYYLACGFCRWTSRDVGIPDQTVASGGWQEQENLHSKRINNLLENYRVLAQQEKLEKERKKLSQRCGYQFFSDKYGISAVVARKLAGLSTIGSKDEESKESEELMPAEAFENIDPLPEEYLTQPVNLAKVCNINQRLMQPEFQPTCTDQLFPRHKHLLIKRSQRCKECEHNLSKPEYNPSSIKFKIQLAAIYHIPEVRVKTIPVLKLNEECKIEVTLYNPTPYAAHVTLLPCENAEEDALFNSKVVLPSSQLVVAARDDTADFDELNDAQLMKDDPKVISFRKSNKIGFYINVMPLKEKENVVVAFQLKHDFVNMVLQLQGDHRESQVVWLTHVLFLDLGPIQNNM